MKASGRWLLLGVLFPLSGCLFGQGAGPVTVATRRASAEFNCPKSQVKATKLSGGTVRVHACGKVATYSCMGGNVGNPYDARCTREAVTSANGSASNSAGCGNDSQCKGQRICQNGHCVNPPAPAK